MRRRWPWLAVAGVVLALVVVVWFQPQKLLIDERVEEPVVAGDGGGGVGDGDDAAAEGTAAEGDAGPVELATGEFVSLDHGTRGGVRVLDLGDGMRSVRLEGLDT